MTYTCFDLEFNGKIAHIRFNRPEKLNTMIPAFWNELPAAIEEIEGKEGIRCIVISSTGKHFTAGMDLSVFGGNGAIDTGSAIARDGFRSLVLTLQETFNRLENTSVPVIAAIQGGCIGGGVDMVSACDLRFATSSAFFCIQEINIGIMADLGTLQRLPRLIPEGIVRELAYTGSKLSAARAYELGLVNEVFDSEEEMVNHVMKIAETISSRSPLAVSASKEAINYARDHSVEDSLRQAANVQAAIFDIPQMVESMNAQKEKRQPVYPDLKAGARSL